MGGARPRPADRGGRSGWWHRPAARSRGDRSAVGDPAARAHRRALARAAPRVQRSALERSGAARARIFAGGARGEPPQSHARRGVHDAPGPRDGGRRLRRRGPQAGGQPGHRAGSAARHHHKSDRGDGHLRAERVLAGVGNPARRAGGGRRHPHSRSPRAGRKGRGLDQGVRRLPCRAARRSDPDVFGR